MACIFHFQFGSNSDLTSGPDRKFPSPIQSLKQRDDSGIYGSATSLPSHMTQDSSRQSHSLSASPIMHARDASWTPDIHSSRLRPHSVIAPDVRSVRSQPSQHSSSASEFYSSSRPHSTYISSLVNILLFLWKITRRVTSL